MPARRLRPVTPAVVRAQVVIEEHDAARDGSFAVIVRRFVQAGAYRSHLWLVPLEGRQRPRRLTHGATRDTRPRIAADGRNILFRRAPVQTESAMEEPPKARLMVLSLSGGEPRPVSAPDGAVEEAEWSRDGKRIAFTAQVDPLRSIQGAHRAGKPPLARRVRRLDFRSDGEGHLDRWTHLFVVSAHEGARARRITSGDFNVSGICWSPDGQEIAFAADRRPDSDIRPRQSIWAVAAGGGDPREVMALGRDVRAPAWSPDGRWLAATGVIDPDALDDVSPGIVVGPADGSAPARALAPALDRPVGAWIDSDLNGWMVSSTDGPAWVDDRTIVALVSDRGRSLPWRFEFDGSGQGAITNEEAGCWTLTVSPDAPAGPLVSVVGTLDTRPMELMTVAASGGLLRTRTNQGSRWMGGLRWPQMQRELVPGPGGPIETWIASPPGAGDTARPTIVHVHGGPLGAWAPAPSVDDVILCSAGYRVISPNIRGSATYGHGWIGAQLGDWGGADAADVHAALDHVIGLGLADPDRLGALGLSYGGFMVHWLIATSDRFRAAVAENGVANQVSAWANSDTGVDYCRTSLLGDPLTRQGMEKLWRQSPLAHVSEVSTPLLMLQAEADLRCPPADNEQFFTALRVLGREVEYVLYPDESHTYSVIGRPDRREDRMTRMLEWFQRFMPA